MAATIVSCVLLRGATPRDPDGLDLEEMSAKYQGTTYNATLTSVIWAIVIPGMMSDRRRALGV